MNKIEAKTYSLGLSLPAIVIFLYWQVEAHALINFDSVAYLSGNKRVIQGLTSDNFIWALQATSMSNWHPLTWLSYMLEVQIFGVDARASHLINVFIHAANAGLTFILLFISTNKIWPSYLVALIFAIHPAQVESVAWIAERKDVLFCFFFICGLIAYRSYCLNKKIVNYLTLIILFTLGLMSKPMMITFPFVLMLCDYWPANRFYTAQGISMSSVWRSLLEKLPLFFLSLTVVFITYQAQFGGGAMAFGEQITLAPRLENSLVAYAFYIKQAFFPSSLSLFYPHPRSWGSHTLFLSFLVVACVIALALHQYRRNPPIFFGVALFLGTLVPTIGLVQVGLQAYADRYTYLPYIGLFVAVCFGLEPLVRGPTKLYFARSAAVGFSIVLLFQTSQYIGAWKNSASIWGHSLMSIDPNYHSVLAGPSVGINNKPQSNSLSFPYVMMGIALLSEGRLDLGLAHLERAKQLGMVVTGGWYWYGRALLEKGLVQQAFDSFDVFEQHNPSDQRRIPEIQKLREAYGQ